MELKRGVKVMQERQDALHRCMTGRSLKDTTPGETGYRNALALMERGLATLTEHTGIKIE
jgi:hypothetical protein